MKYLHIHYSHLVCKVTWKNNLLLSNFFEEVTEAHRGEVAPPGSAAAVTDIY